MARSIRIEYSGALYHVMARGHRREAIFFNDDDRCAFLKTLGEACELDAPATLPSALREFIALSENEP